MKTSIIALSVLSALTINTAAHAAISEGEQAAAFQQFKDAATAFNTLPDNTPSNMLNDKYNEAKAGLTRLGVPAGEQDDLIGNAHNLASVSDLSGWIGGLKSSQVSPVTMAAPGHFTPTPSQKVEAVENVKGNQVKRALINQAERREAVAHESRYQGMTHEAPTAEDMQEEANNAKRAAYAASHPDREVQMISPAAPVNGSRLDLLNQKLGGVIANVQTGADVAQQELKDRFAKLKAAKEEGEQMAQANRDRASSQHVDPSRITADEQEARDHGQDLAINDAHATASQAMLKANSAYSLGETVHHEAMVIGQDVDTNTANIADNKSVIDRHTAEITGLANSAITNAQGIADNKSAITGVVSQVTANADQIADQGKAIADNAEHISDNATAISGKVDKATYSHDKLTQHIVDADQDQTIAQNKADQAVVNQGLADQVSANKHTIDHNTTEIGKVQTQVDADHLVTVAQGNLIDQNKADQVNTDAAQSKLITDNTTAAKAADDKAQTAQTTAQAANSVAQAAKLLADGQEKREQTAGSSRYQAMTAARAQAVADNTPKAKDGLNGKDGATGATGQAGKDGADGVTTVKHEVDTKTQNRVTANETAIRGVRDEQKAQGDFVQAQSQVVSRHSRSIDRNTAQIQQNSKRIDKNASDIADTRKDLKHGLNNAAAQASLHFNGNKDSWALSTGTYNGEGAAIAAGLQKSISEHAAVTVQFSGGDDGDFMAGVGIHGDY